MRSFSFCLAAILLGILLLVLPVSAATVDLSQSYKCFSANFVKWENFDSPLDVVVDKSVLMWVNFHNLPTNNPLVFKLTFNDQTQVMGSIITQDTSAISSTTILSLGSTSNTSSWSHLPYVGVAPRYNLGYGIDANGLHYLVLLDESRTGSSPKDGRHFTIDTNLDANMPISPPAMNPIIRFEKVSSSLPSGGGFGGGGAGGRSGDDPPSLDPPGVANMDGYVLDYSSLQNGCPAADSSWLDRLLGAVTAGLGIFMFVGSFLVDNIAYLPLVMFLGIILLFWWCVQKKGVIGGGGMFIEKCLYLADIVQRILSYSIDAFYKIWDALVKWL
jgi:hypothetical protein